MEWNIQIDELQEDKFINPIFYAMKKYLSDEQLANIYFETKLPQYMQFLPDTLVQNPDFIKKAISLEMMDYDRIPDNLKTTDFLTRDEYISLLKNRAIDLDNRMYPQDEEIILAGAKGIFNLKVIDEQFRKDIDLMIKLFSIEPRLFHQAPEEQKNTIWENRQSLKQLLRGQKHFFHDLPEELKTDNSILKIMLEDKDGFKILKDQEYIRKITDPDLVLDVLKISGDSKIIHQKFSTIIKKHGAQKDAYNFLKTYLQMNTLENSLTSNVDKAVKVKI